MIYRKIKKEEAKDFANISATAFHFNAKECYDDIEKGGFLEDTIRVMENDEGRIEAGLRLYDLKMRLGTQYVKCGGIGDVSSYPEYRRGGNISKLMNHTLKEMYDEDYVISYLYPFSHPFYRKYGYELCRRKDIISFDPECTAYKKDEGYAKQHVMEGKDDLSDDIKKIYSIYAQKMNFMGERLDWQWERVLKKDAYTSDARVYVCYSKEDEPIAYLLYKYEKLDFPEMKIKVFDMGFVDREAFDVILRFIYRLAPAVKVAEMACPAIINPLDIFDEAYDVKIKSEPGGMMRIVNVEKALSVIKVPYINTKIAIKVTDENLDANNGVFVMDVKDGKITVTKQDAEPDLECSIQILSQLVCGFMAIDDVAHKENVAVNSKINDLRHIFIKKPVHIQDFF